MNEIREKLKTNKLGIFFYFKISFILLTIILLIFLFYQVNYWTDSYFLDPIFESMIMTVLLLTISLILIVGAITLLEYKTKFSNKQILSTSRSYLTIEDVFNNENRINIISQILKNPGIHHNELLRTCNLQKGQLQWHLDILLKNKIIQKENQGQYTLYYANNQIIKSSQSIKEGIIDTSSTKKILDIIRENPGITSTNIAERINLARNTVSYHVDKLIEANLIKLLKKGRKKEIFPIKNSQM